MIFCACTSSGETARASSSTVSSPAAAVSCGRNPIVAFFSIAIVPLSGETSPRRSENKVDLPAPLGPTNPIRSPRLTWSDRSSKGMFGIWNEPASHRQYRHDQKKGVVTIAGKHSDDLAAGTQNSILKQAGLK